MKRLALLVIYLCASARAEGLAEYFAAIKVAKAEQEKIETMIGINSALKLSDNASICELYRNSKVVPSLHIAFTDGKVADFVVYGRNKKLWTNQMIQVLSVDAEGKIQRTENNVVWGYPPIQVPAWGQPKSKTRWRVEREPWIRKPGYDRFGDVVSFTFGRADSAKLARAAGCPGTDSAPVVAEFPPSQLTSSTDSIPAAR